MSLPLLQVSTVLAALSGVAVAQSAPKPRPASVPYTWKNVQMVGGGFVDGIVFHPTAKGVRYARTDMGGAYRWSEIAHRWEPMLDWVPYENRNWMGVDSIAVDASDANRVYLACGTYTNPITPDGAILRSNDRGKTFQHTNVPFKFGANEPGRGHGERLAVDPHDGGILYLGTRHAGLWKSADHAATWSKVESFPDIAEAPAAAGWQPGQGHGIAFVLFDPRGGAIGKPSSTIYVGVSLEGRANLFRSTDAGKSWQAVSGAPTQCEPARAALASDGALYITYATGSNPYQATGGALWKLDTASGAWTDITPDRPGNGRGFGYGGVSVDAHRPRSLITTTYSRQPGEEVFRSVDGGANWKPVFASGGTYDFSLAPYVARTPIHWMFDIEIDPANSDHAIFTTGYGGYETFNLGAIDLGKPTKWSVMSKGIEETVALDLLSPTEGAHLLTAIGDYGGFVHNDLDKPAPEGNYDRPRFGNTTGLAGAPRSPAMIVRVGRGASRLGGSIGYSMDGGRTWQGTPSTPPGASLGSVAVSSDGNIWVWTPERGAVYFTRDSGGRWTKSEGIPEDTRVIADPIDPNKFYGLALFDGKLFVSTDGAATFIAQRLTLPDGLPARGDREDARGDDRGGQDRIYATPGKTGDLWLAAFNGLYHSADSGVTFARLGRVEQIHGFGFGQAAPGTTAPTLFLIGVVDGARGIFRSTNTAKSWVRINDDQHQWGLLLHVTGDPKRYGRVYVGTHGRGTVYGDPAAH